MNYGKSQEASGAATREFAFVESGQYPAESVIVVRASMTDGPLTAAGLLEAIQSAFTSWYVETEEGASAWDAANGHPNLGDVLDNLREEGVRSRLSAAGVSSLEHVLSLSGEDVGEYEAIADPLEVLDGLADVYSGKGL